MNLDDTDYKLLESVEEKPRYLDMGRSPVDAIMRCFALANWGLVSLNDNNVVYLTDKGREVLKLRSESF